MYAFVPFFRIVATVGIALVSHDYTLLSIPFSTLFHSTLRRVAL